MRIFIRNSFNLVQNHRRNISSSVLDILPEIQSCLKLNKPVVALESAIITHGMPYPVNFETAKACQDVIRNEGCVPALIAILNGRIKVGLKEEELHYLAQGGSGKTFKTSRRDFPYVVGNKLDGGTTVSGTVVVANAVGIKVFATGGAGGVHRRGQETLDISADLVELGRNPIMVVSSGVKSILDIDRTLEYLETQGVLVSTYGPERLMPAFFSSYSSFKTPYNVNSPFEAASLIHGMTNMNLKSGILLAVPIPQEYSIDYNLMESHINRALKEADDKKISGKEITPFLLDRISSLTKGKSIESNVALVTNNSQVAAKIALAYSEIGSIKNRKQPTVKISERNPVVIGGSVVDYTVSLADETKMDGRTVNASMDQWCGGVGRNLADALGKLNNKPSFISAVADDQNGKTILESLSHIDNEAVEVLENERTAAYMVLMDDKGDCLLCAGNSDIHNKTNSDQIKRHLGKIDNSNFIILDSNIPSEAIEFVINYTSKLSIPIWIEPTSLLKCHKFLTCPSADQVNYISPNLIELKQMSEYYGVSLNGDFDYDNVDELLKQVLFLCEGLLQNIQLNIMVTLGKYGTMMVNQQLNTPRSGNITARYYPVYPPNKVINSSGAGDCIAAGFISGLLLGLPEAKCISLAYTASKASLLSKSPVPHEFIEHDSNLESANFITISV